MELKSYDRIIFVLVMIAVALGLMAVYAHIFNVTGHGLYSSILFKGINTSITTTIIMNENTTQIYNNQTPLQLPNTTLINSQKNGQRVPLYNGTLIFSSNNLYYTPDAGNIYAYGIDNWSSATFVTINSTFAVPLFLKNVFFKVNGIPPANIKVYQYVNESLSSFNQSNQTTTYFNNSYWQLLNANDLILSSGINRFEVIGSTYPNKVFNYSLEFSTGNETSYTLPQNETLTIGNLTLNSKYLQNYDLNVLPHLQTLPTSSYNLDPSWNPPAGATFYINVSLNNPTSITDNVGLQIPLTFNGLNFSGYFNGNDNNIEIFNGLTGNIEISWLEANSFYTSAATPPNIIQAYSINTINNTVDWFKSDFSIAPATNAVNVISIAIFPMSTVVFNGNNVGEAPYLTSSYAQYDNGANVFTTYQAWGGLAALPSGWTRTDTLGTGLSFTATNTLIDSSLLNNANGIFYTAQNGLPYSYNTIGNTIDSIVNYTAGAKSIIGIAANPTGVLAGARFLTLYKIGAGVCGFANNLCYDSASGSGIVANILSPNSIVSANTYVLSEAMPIVTGTQTANVYTDYGLRTAIGTGSQNPLVLSTAKNPNVFLYYSENISHTIALYISRTRTTPPNDLFPTQIFNGCSGSNVCNAVSTTSTTTTSTTTTSTTTIPTGVICANTLPHLNSTSIYKNSNTTNLAVFSDSEDNVIASFAPNTNVYEVLNTIPINTLGGATNLEQNLSSTLLVPPSYYFKYIIKTNAVMHCEWIAQLTTTNSVTNNTKYYVINQGYS